MNEIICDQPLEQVKSRVTPKSLNSTINADLSVDEKAYDDIA